MNAIRNKNRALIIPLLALCLTLSGCKGVFPNARDITDFKLISIMGADTVPESPGLIEFTVSAKQPSSPGENSAEVSKPLLLSGRAPSATAVYWSMETYTDKHLFLGYAHFYLVGRGLAELDIGQALDFLLRNPDTRLDTKIFVVENGTALELLSKASSNNSFAADRLNSFEKDVQQISDSSVVDVVDLSNMLENGGMAVIPMLRLIPLNAHDPSADEDIEQPSNAVPSGEGEGLFDFELGGYAVFRDYRMIDTISIEDARGLNLLQDKFYYDTLSVAAPDGMPAALQMEEAKVKYSLEWEGGAPSKLIVELDFKSILSESQSPGHVDEPGFLESLAAAQNALIRQRLEDMLFRSKLLDVDFIGISGALARRYPFRFPKYKDAWPEIWKDLDYEVRVSSVVTASYNIINPD